MVLCLIALPVLLVLGIFSVKYRQLAKDALECLFTTVTLRKCKSGLDDRIRSQITGRLLRFSPKAASIVYRHYKLFSWIVLIILVWSAYESGIGAYNYYYYGNCNGPEATGFCLLDPTGEHSGVSESEIDAQKEIVYPAIEIDDPVLGNKNATLTIIEFGCYACPYTKKAEPIVKEVLEYYNGKVNLQFKTFVIPRHQSSYSSAMAANCAAAQDTYDAYHDELFRQQENITNSSYAFIAQQLGLNTTAFDECMKQEKFKQEVEADTLAGMQAGVIGTPTFFVNKQKIVGPKPFRTFKTIINEELENV